MRILIILATTVLGIATAGAQTSSFTAERGHWTVYSGPKILPRPQPHAGRLQLRAL